MTTMMADVFSLHTMYGQWPTLWHPQSPARGLRDTLASDKGLPIEGEIEDLVVLELCLRPVLILTHCCQDRLSN